MKEHYASFSAPMTRRRALQRIGGGFGLVGLSAMTGESLLQAATSSPMPGPLNVKAPHYPAKAKKVIFLFLNGGVSHMDTFDPKPMLDKYHGKPLPGGNPATSNTTGNLMRSPFKFKKYGQSGIEVSEIFPLVGQCADDLCVIRSMYTETPTHEPSMLMLNCGTLQMGRPSLGSWLTYGLGTENQSLPGYVVLCPGPPSIGSPLWSSAFLPAVYQGTLIRDNASDPAKMIEFIASEQHTRLSDQKQQIQTLEELNRVHLRGRENNLELEARIHAMEVAFRMQTEAPEAFDVSKETKATRELYGQGDFANGCLMARRLVERGVRIVQVYFCDTKGMNWDSHADIMEHKKLAFEADRPIAALINDLKSRGLLNDTLVVVGTEFGRTPVLENRAALAVNNGRDHNHLAFSILLAGGGVKGGFIHGSTDDFGFRTAESPVNVHDLHATIMHLMGLDHTRLTYRYSGRDFRLTDVHGNVVQNIIS